MSTKSTLFLTNDDEHFYQDLDDPHYRGDKWIGDTLVLEMNKKNINILFDGYEELIIEITNPESELYKHMMKMRDDLDLVIDSALCDDEDVDPVVQFSCPECLSLRVLEYKDKYQCRLCWYSWPKLT